MAAADDLHVGNPGDDGIVVEIMVRDVGQNPFGDILRADDFQLEVLAKDVVVPCLREPVPSVE